MLALMAYEDGVCGCGFHTSLTEDATNFFTFDTRECPVCRAAARMSRTQEAEDKARDKHLGEDPLPSAYRAGDGRKTFIRLMRPDEVEEMNARRSVPQKAPRDQDKPAK